MKRVEEECLRELQLKEQKRKELYAKQGRGSQFTTKVKKKRVINTRKVIKEQILKDILINYFKDISIHCRMKEISGFKTSLNSSPNR